MSKVCNQLAKYINIIVIWDDTVVIRQGGLILQLFKVSKHGTNFIILLGGWLSGRNSSIFRETVGSRRPCFHPRINVFCYRSDTGPLITVRFYSPTVDVLIGRGVCFVYCGKLCGRICFYVSLEFFIVHFEPLRYKPECRRFDFRWCHWNFSLT